MGTAVFPFFWRRLAVRAFRDRELEHEFRRVFRSSGVRFFEIGTAISGIAYLAFFLIYAVSRTRGPLAQPQPLRRGDGGRRFFRRGIGALRTPFVVRHYEMISSSVIVIGIVCTLLIASLVQWSESPILAIGGCSRLRYL